MKRSFDLPPVGAGWWPALLVAGLAAVVFAPRRAAPLNRGSRSVPQKPSLKLRGISPVPPVGWRQLDRTPTPHGRRDRVRKVLYVPPQFHWTRGEHRWP